MLKSKIVCAILAVLVAGSVFAGGGKQGGATVDGNSKELRVLNYIDFTQSNAAADYAWTWDNFKAQNPDVTIVLEDLYNEPYHQKTEAYVASGNIPDVLYVWPSGRSTSLHTKKLLKDLTPLFQKDGLGSVYPPIVTDKTQYASGYLSMIPRTLTASHAFYVNLEVLNACGLQPAKTYAEMKAQVATLRARGYETVIMPNQDTWVMQSCLFSTIAGRFGGADWHEKILNGQAKFTDPDFVNALNFVKALYDDGVIAASSLGMGYGDGPGAFATNKGAYYIDGDWRNGAFLTDSETGVALISPARQRNIQITVFPDIEGAKLNKSTSVIMGTGWAMSAAIPAGSPREDAAWRLIKWLTGKEQVTRDLSSGAYGFALRNDIDTSSLPLEPMQVTMANLGSQYTTGTVVIDGVFHSDVFNPLNDGLQEIGMGTKTPQQVAADIQKAFDDAKKAGKF